MFEELSELDNVPLMIRLQHKAKLIDSLDKIFLSIASHKKAYPKGFEKTSVRSLMKDFRKGLKVIDKKNPVFIEMPKLEEVSNGQVKKTYRNNVDELSSDEEVFVNLPPDNTGFIEN